MVEQVGADVVWWTCEVYCVVRPTMPRCWKQQARFWVRRSHVGKVRGDRALVEWMRAREVERWTASVGQSRTEPSDGRNRQEGEAHSERRCE